MNIFVTDSCPYKSAAFLDDKRVVKMVTESVQMLSTAINVLGGNGVYRTTHINHPCNVWVRKSYSNWLWLYRHAEGLAREYQARYGRVHGAYSKLVNSSMLDDARKLISDCDLTPFANCAANQSSNMDFRDIPDVHLAYRKYLKARWALDKRAPTRYKKVFDYGEI